MVFEQKVKIQIQKLVCGVHGMTPKVVVSKGDVKLQCCCTDFEIKCYNELIRLLESKLKMDRFKAEHKSKLK